MYNGEASCTPHNAVGFQGWRQKKKSVAKAAEMKHAKNLQRKLSPRYVSKKVHRGEPDP